MDLRSLAVSFLLSLIVPIIVIAIRQTVKLHRREIIQDLAAVFHTAKEPESERMIPSFEFVKFKYFVPTGKDRGQRQDFQIWSWAVAIVPFFLIVSSASYVCIEYLQSDRFASPLFGEHEFLRLCFIASSAAFCGAYLNSMKTLTQSIQNFDLSPSLIVALATQIFSGIVLAAIFGYAAHAVLGTLPENPPLVPQVVALLGFAIGFFPDAAQRTLVGRSKLRNFKRENLSVFKYTLATPVELIDGIDTEIRNRLGDFHIATTQNLATANPLMLFVETPFGVYQIMDWVAQAQLCASVGPEAMTSMWRLGVRTLFDLERAALDDRCRHPELLQAIGRHLLGQKDDKSDYSAEAIAANIQMRLDDPHVHRLRQIYMQVGERIGEKHLRFLTRGESFGAGSRGYDGTGMVFQKPNRIRIADSKVDIRPNDYLAVVGGKNDGRLLKVGGVDGTFFTVDQPVVDEVVAAGESPVRLFRINP